MKALKIIVSIIVIVVAIFLIVALFLPKKTIIEKEITIKAPIEVIFGQLNCLKNMANWSPFDDSTMVSTYEGPECGVGCKQSWVEGESEGGTQVIVESVEFSDVKTELDFGEMGTATAAFNLEESDEGVVVKWSFESDACYPIGRWIGVIFVKPKLSKNYVKGLDNLKEYVEALPPPAPEFTISEIEEKVIESSFALSIKDSCLMIDMGSKRDEMITKMMAHIGENQIQPIGSPLSVFYIWNPEGISTFSYAITVAEETPVTEGIELIETYSGNVVTITYYGSYDKSETAWNAMDNYIKANEKIMMGAPWEVYLVGPDEDPDPAKYVTQIFFPVE